MECLDKQVLDHFKRLLSTARRRQKAILSTPLPDGMYYEITLNGDKGEIYLDAYKKFENRCIRIEERE